MLPFSMNNLYISFEEFYLLISYSEGFLIFLGRLHYRGSELTMNILNNISEPYM